MKGALYMDDSYLKEFNSKVVSVKGGKYIVLEETAFYPVGGGQPCDTGVLVKGDKKFKVVFVGKFDGKISHEVSEIGLEEGDSVKGVIDWDKRYKYMRMHTACHLISAIFHNKAGAMITGGQIDLEKSRVDFSLENFDREKMQEFIDLANQIIEKDLPVKFYYKDREEAMKIPGMVKLAGALPPSVTELRIVEIEGVDTQADGGCHVKSLKEIGRIELVSVDNKGKNNRRVYFSVK
tara:strand:- start:2290 stop:2997 length:708 start_codon:yes stop_codon:yes gene_type:complete